MVSNNKKNSNSDESNLIKKFDGQDKLSFDIWKCSLETALEVRKMEQTIKVSGYTSTEFQQTKCLYNYAYEKRLADDKKAKQLIQNSVTTNVYKFIIKCQTAYDAFKVISDKFDKVGVFQLYTQNRKMTKIRYIESRAVHIREFLYEYEAICDRYLGTGKELHEHSKAMHFYEALPPLYQEKMEAVSKDDDLKLLDYDFMANQAEKYYEKRKDKGEIPEDVALISSAPEVDATAPTAPSYPMEIGLATSQITCWNCQKPGHPKYLCPDLAKEEKRAVEERYQNKRKHIGKFKKKGKVTQPYSRAETAKVTHAVTKKVLKALLAKSRDDDSDEDGENEKNKKHRTYVASVASNYDQDPVFRDEEIDSYVKEFQAKHSANVCRTNEVLNPNNTDLEIKYISKPGIPETNQYTSTSNSFYQNVPMKYKYHYNSVKKSDKCVKVMINGQERNLCEGEMLPCPASAIQTINNGTLTPFIYYKNFFGKNYCSFEDKTIPAGSLLPIIPRNKVPEILSADVLVVHLQKLYEKFGCLFFNLVHQNNLGNFLWVWKNNKCTTLYDTEELDVKPEDIQVMYEGEKYNFTFYKKVRKYFATWVTPWYEDIDQTESVIQDEPPLTVTPNNTAAVLTPSVTPTASVMQSATLPNTATETESDQQSTELMVNESQYPEGCVYDSEDSEELDWASDVETPDVKCPSVPKQNVERFIRKRVHKKREAKDYKNVELLRR